MFDQYCPVRSSLPTNEEALKSVALSDPWSTYQRKLKALFENDDCIEIGDLYGDKSPYTIPVKIFGQHKASAFQRLVVNPVQFGNVTVNLDVEVISDNVDNMLEDARILFANNDSVVDVKVVDDVTGTPHGFVLFEPEVVQFFNDNLSDYYGSETTLYQTIAKELLLGHWLLLH